VARAISRAGVCSRTEAAARVAAGRVRIDGRVVLDPEHPTTRASRIEIDGVAITTLQRVYLMLNKPRGLVTSTTDERGRDTVYRCLETSGLPWVAPVGRLDKASEGLLLFSNDPGWSAGITEPASGLIKRYHVSVDCIPEDDQLAALVNGIDVAGQQLAARAARLLRTAERTAWLEIELDEGRNRQIRRLLEALDIGVRRLVRVAIGSLTLGDLPKGGWRNLSAAEVAALAAPASR
jgi:23S rRNA pseudouridine2605 synthase